MANHHSTSAGPSNMPEAVRPMGLGRNVVVEILDDSDEADQETGIATQVARQVQIQLPTCIPANWYHHSASSAPNSFNQEQALQNELADIEAESAAYKAELASFTAEAEEHKVMEAKLDAERDKMEAKSKELEVRRRRLEVDSAAYENMRTEYKTRRDEHIAKHEQLKATFAGLKMKHTSYTRRRELARQSQNEISHTKNADQTLPDSQANIERPVQRPISSQQGTPQLQRIRAEVREVIDVPGEALQQLGFAPISSTGSPGELHEGGSASNLDADGDSAMSLAPDQMSAEPQPPKKFRMSFQEESSSSSEPVPKAKLSRRKPCSSRRPTKKK
ncbi:hypothetical protein M436DRAFT_64571 [Aureobasidium namibiae CBS 147.97]|uniref:Uncharacterized protein n=1 Tax=Aureobasidium namibiae CBS 147.97 TaxID=1043004 RepID=A0A074WLV3_9PEZI